MRSCTTLPVLALLCLLLLSAVPGAQGDGPPEGPEAARLGLPLAFVENAGQWDARVRFRAVNGPLTAFLERDAITMDLAVSRGEDCAEGVIVRLVFEGAADAALTVGDGALVGLSDFFVGPRSAHRTDVPSFEAVRYHQLYPGVDLLARDGAHLFEYDLFLSPGAALDQVVVRCEGVEGLRLDTDGALVMETARGPVRQAPPVTWQRDAAGVRTPVACAYRILDATRFGFAAPGRDAARALVVDPGIEWSTLVNSTGLQHEFVQDVALAPNGDVVACGQTFASSFPTTLGAYDTSFNGNRDAFVVRFDPAQVGIAELVYSTFLGGSGEDRANSCSVDGQGVLTVVGWTASTNFPTTPGAYDQTDNPLRDVFVCRIDPLPGTAQLVYSTLIGGALRENGNDHDVDAAGVITVLGWTDSADFPAKPGSYDTVHNGGKDLFVLRLDPALVGAAQLRWSTYVGGSGDDACWADNLAVEDTGVVTVAGFTDSPNFPTTPGAYQTGPAGGLDAVVCRLDPARRGPAQLLASTYLGGTLDENSRVDVGTDGVVTVSGWTASGDFPTTTGVLQPVHPVPGADTCFVSRLDTGLSSLLASTFLGGSTGGDGPNAVTTGSSGLVTLVGSVASPDFPTTPGAFEETFQGGGTIYGQYDAFVSRLNPDLDQLLYSTFLGGATSHDFAYAVDVDEQAFAVVGGVTRSSDFPTTPGAYDTSYAGADDGYLTLLDMLPTGVSAYGASTPGCNGPLAMGVNTKPAVGDLGFELFCTNAPAGGTGFLGFALNPLPASVSALGIDLWIDPSTLVGVLGTPGGAGSFATTPLPLQPTWIPGWPVHAQYIWLDACGSLGFSASNALTITLQ